ncbi:methyltransferase domain-containing protein [bacterium]|nr:methyltransferase domain-containing protein [bacterium]
MRPGPLIFGLATYIPGVYKLRSKGTGGTVSARYCYSVWLRHRVLAGKSGFTDAPQVIAELGPGDSLGIGLAGLISGSETCYALDVVAYADAERNEKIFEELIQLFSRREPVPDDSEFPEVLPALESYSFPSDLYSAGQIKTALQKERLTRIRKAIRSLGSPETSSCLSYAVPWTDSAVLPENSVDFIISQAVLEHVDGLAMTYRALFRWLKPGGHMSHVIDFSSHRLTDVWNEHWSYSPFLWKCIRGKRPFLINREPFSTHVRLAKENGFLPLMDRKVMDESGIRTGRLAPSFRHLTEQDLKIKKACMLSVKPKGGGKDA